MDAIDRSEVGAHVSGRTVTLGVYLPGIRAADGFQVLVKIIHRADQFTPEIPPVPSPDLSREMLRI